MNPIINRGTWSRVFSITWTIDRVINNLKSNNKLSDNKDGVQLQIINIGCGLDTLFFNVKDKYENLLNINFVDFDYEQIVKKKVRINTNCYKFFKIDIIKHSEVLKARINSDMVLGILSLLINRK